MQCRIILSLLLIALLLQLVVCEEGGETVNVELAEGQQVGAQSTGQELFGEVSKEEGGNQKPDVWNDTEFEQELLHVFGDYDTDASGLLQKQEMFATIEQDLPDKQSIADAVEMIKSLYDAYDSDKNGLDWEEFKQMALIPRTAFTDVELEDESEEVTGSAAENVTEPEVQAVEEAKIESEAGIEL